MLSLHYSSYTAEEDAALQLIEAAADNGSETLQLSRHSHMREIPEAVKILREQLVELSLDNNYSLTSLPSLLGDFPHLRSLDVSYCSIAAVSPAVCRLSRLTKLMLSNNRISFLPSEMGHLKRLEDLRLDNNKLRVLPGGLVFLPKLRQLTVENNPLYTPEQIAGAAHVTLVPPQASVDCANCCVRAQHYQVSVSFHRLPCFGAEALPFAFFVCSDECYGHLSRRLEQHDAAMREKL